MEVKGDSRLQDNEFLKEPMANHSPGLTCSRDNGAGAVPMAVCDSWVHKRVFGQQTTVSKRLTEEELVNRPCKQNGENQI